MWRALTPSGTALYYHYDRQGSTIAITNTSQNITNAFAYEPFGALVNRAGSTENPFRFIGKYGVATESSGLMFMRARYYDPQTGRFLIKDPMKGIDADPQTLNYYLYGKSNPLVNIDPLGLFNWETAIAGGLQIVTGGLEFATGVGLVGFGITFATGGTALSAGLGAPIAVPVGAAIALYGANKMGAVLTATLGGFENLIIRAPRDQAFVNRRIDVIKQVVDQSNDPTAKLLYAVDELLFTVGSLHGGPADTAWKKFGDLSHSTGRQIGANTRWFREYARQALWKLIEKGAVVESNELLQILAETPEPPNLSLIGGNGGRAK